MRAQSQPSTTATRPSAKPWLRITSAAAACSAALTTSDRTLNLSRSSQLPQGAPDVPLHHLPSPAAVQAKALFLWWGGAQGLKDPKTLTFASCALWAGRSAGSAVSHPNASPSARSPHSLSSISLLSRQPKDGGVLLPPSLGQYWELIAHSGHGLCREILSLPAFYLGGVEQ